MSWSRGRQPAVLGARGANQRRHRPDYMLMVISAVLLVIGMVVVYSISPGLAAQREVSENYYVSKQALAILLGIGAFLFMANVPISTWRHVGRPLIALAVVITLVALILPTSAEYPARRWIRFGGLSLQSVEFIKFATLACLAGFLADKLKQGLIADFDRTLKPLLIVLGVIGLVVGVAQRDFGSAAVIVAMMAAMGFVAGMPLRRVAVVGVLVVIALVLLILPFSYRRDRVLDFLHPEQNCLTSGYQACQALIAVGSGGLFGKGLAHSVQAYGYLPEAANDSIFAIFAEKFGFIGVTILVLLFVALFTRLKNIMERAPDMFSRLLVAGILAWLSTQTIINMGAMLGLLPLKGITLPFISYGGTSVLFVTGAIGLTFNISRYTSYAVDSGETITVPGRSRQMTTNYSTRRNS